MKLEANGGVTGKTYELAKIRRIKEGDTIATTPYNEKLAVYFSHADVSKLLREFREFRATPIKTQDIRETSPNDWTRTFVVDPEAKELAKAMRERIFGPVEVIK